VGLVQCEPRLVALVPADEAGAALAPGQKVELAYAESDAMTFSDR
jgi:hypothetical protein